MAYPNESDEHNPMANPAEHMQMGEMLQFLQHGYEAPIQAAIKNHAEHNNAWQADLENMQAFRHVIQDVLSASAEDEAHAPLDPGQLAAYIDGNLSAEEAAVVQAQLGNDPMAYRQFAAVEHERTHRVPLRLRTPGRALAGVKVSAETIASTEATQAQSLLERIEGWLQPIFAPQWAMPAYSFALGLLVMMLVLWPSGSQTVVYIPSMMTAETEEGIAFGVDGETVVPNVMVLPAEGDLTLTWQAVEGIASYSLDVYDANNASILHVDDLTVNQFTLDASMAQGDATYTLSVMGRYPEGGVLPVVNLAFKRASVDVP